MGMSNQSAASGRSKIQSALGARNPVDLCHSGSLNRKNNGAVARIGSEREDAGRGESWREHAECAEKVNQVSPEERVEAAEMSPDRPR